MSPEEPVFEQSNGLGLGIVISRIGRVGLMSTPASKKWRSFTINVFNVLSNPRKPRFHDAFNNMWPMFRKRKQSATATKSKPLSITEPGACTMTLKSAGGAHFTVGGKEREREKESAM